VSRYSVAAVEAGRGGRLPLERLVAMVAAVGGYLSLRIVFQGEALDRLRDRRHAALVEAMATDCEPMDGTSQPRSRSTTSRERGSIDILAYHAATRTLLVIEKTVVPDIGGSLATLDRKVRLAPDLAQARGWNPRTVARLLVMPEASTVRRRIGSHEATFANAFPARNVEVNRWLRAPVGSLSGLIFLSSARMTGPRRRSMRAPDLQDARPRTIPAREPVK
jgi:hypothetical protein